MKREQSIALIWNHYDQEHCPILGRYSLKSYIDMIYKKYKELCFITGEKPLDISKWLTENVE